MAQRLNSYEPPPPSHGPFHAIEPTDQPPAGQFGPPPAFYPLSFGRIVQLGWSIFRYRWRSIVLAGSIVFVPAYLISIPISVIFSPILDNWVIASQAAAEQGLAQPPLPDNFGSAAIAFIASTLLLLVASLIVAAATVRIVDGTYRGESIGGVQAVRFGLGRLGAIAVAQLLYYVAVAVIVMLGIMLTSALIIGGGLLAFLGLIALVSTVGAVLFIAVRAALLIQTISIERVAGSVGFGRSWRLVSGAGWRVFGYSILVALVVSLISTFIGAFTAALLGVGGNSTTDVVASSVIQAALVILVSPLGPIILTLLYYDLRWQHGERVPVPGGDEVAGRPQQPDVRPGTLR